MSKKTRFYPESDSLIVIKGCYVGKIFIEELIFERVTRTVGDRRIEMQDAMNMFSDKKQIGA